MLLRAEGINKNFGGIQALNEVDLHVEEGERLGLIGPNGSGKTTLLNVISGVYAPEKGRVTFDGKDVTRLPIYMRTRLGIARTFQIPRPFKSLSVLENVIIPLMYARSGRPGRDVGEEAHGILERVGIADKAELTPAKLTQIEMRKMELARALAINPKILLLDEVMAGLTASEVDEVLAVLRRLNEEGITIIMVEHIMRAVMTFCERITVLNMGRKIAEGKPQEVSRDEAVVTAYLGE